MTIGSEEIITWAQAPDVLQALEGVPEAADIHSGVVADRADLVRTAIGTALLDRYEAAASEASLARSALAEIGVVVEAESTTPSEEDVVEDTLIEVDAFYGDYNPMAASRLLGVLKRQKGYYDTTLQQLQRGRYEGETEREALQDKLAKLRIFDRLFPNPNRVSLNTLTELLETGLLKDLKNVGEVSVRLTKDVIANQSK